MPFHETLEKFYRKNFREEIRRLGLEESPISPAVAQAPSHMSVYEKSMSRSISSGSTAKAPYVIPPLQLGRPILSPPPLSPVDPTMAEGIPPLKLTPLQQHLTNLIKNGINGVASTGPGDPAMGGSGTLSSDSPHSSFVNVGNGVHPAVGSQSGPSLHTSHVGSLSSFGSLKERFSRLGSLRFGGRGPSSNS